MNNKFNQKVAAGLRNMEITPDAFLFAPNNDEMFGNLSILGIPVFKSALIINTTSDLDIPFIPMWLDDCDYTIQRAMFNSGYEEAL